MKPAATPTLLEPAPKRILAIKLADIGDVLTVTPALRALRLSYPAAQIDLLTTARAVQVLHHSPLVDQVMAFDKYRYDHPKEALTPRALFAGVKLIRGLRSAGYDAAIAFHHLTLRFGRMKFAGALLGVGAPVRAGLDNGHGWFFTHRAEDAGFGRRHEVEYWLEVARAVGATTEDASLECPSTPEARSWARAFLEEHHMGSGIAPFAVIHAGSGGYSLARRWPAERFAAVADALNQRYGLGIVCVGMPADNVGEVVGKMQRPAVNLEGKTDLFQLAALLEEASLFIGADSGVMHLAAAAGAPLVAIFGPSNPDAWGPWTAGRSPAEILRASEPCQPCSYVGHRLGNREGCRGRECMMAVTPEMVLAAAGRVFSSNTPSHSGPTPAPSRAWSESDD